MHMTFWFGYNLDGFFFSSINLTSVTGLVVSCVVLFVLALVYESLKLCLTGLRFKMSLLTRRRGHRCLPIPHQPPVNGSLSDRTELTSAVPLVASTKKTRCMWMMVETLVYIIELIVGYVLMLGVMYYNAVMFIVVVVGLTVGYAFLGPTMVSLQIKTSRMRSKCASCPSDTGSTPPTATTREGSQRGSSSLGESTPESTHEMQCCPPPNGGDISQTTSSTTISNMPPTDQVVIN